MRQRRRPRAPRLQGRGPPEASGHFMDTDNSPMGWGTLTVSVLCCRAVQSVYKPAVHYQYLPWPTGVRRFPPLLLPRPWRTTTPRPRSSVDDLRVDGSKGGGGGGRELGGGAGRAAHAQPSSRCGTSATARPPRLVGPANVRASSPVLLPTAPSPASGEGVQSAGAPYRPTRGSAPPLGRSSSPPCHSPPPPFSLPPSRPRAGQGGPPASPYLLLSGFPRVAYLAAMHANRHICTPSACQLRPQLVGIRVGSADPTRRYRIACRP